MPKAYAVVSYRSTPDPQRLAEYAKLALPAGAPFGARILARGDAAIVLEHGLKERIHKYPWYFDNLPMLHFDYKADPGHAQVDLLAEVMGRWLCVRFTGSGAA